MLNEFYSYIANNTLSFFQSRGNSIQPGERFCLNLDSEEMVNGVDNALRNVTNQNGIQGFYEYENVYSTFTIKLSNAFEVVVAPKIEGMTNDFLATLRNAELTAKRFPILMITHSAIDTITSGTCDLSANGMPFHAQSIISKIKHDISDAQLPTSDKILLEWELERKQKDKFSDKSSLYEYSDLLSILGRGFVKENDYHFFSLLPDPEIKNWIDEKKITTRLNENHAIFEQINRVFKYGNVSEDLSGEFDKEFIKHIENCKKKSLLWYQDVTYGSVKASQDKIRKKWRIIF